MHVHSAIMGAQRYLRLALAASFDVLLARRWRRGTGPMRRVVVPLFAAGALTIALLPEAVEAAAYYVVSEALTNVARYAEATAATVHVTDANGELRVGISDDGTGGADLSRGSGLQGLRDRIEAIGGRLEVLSPPGRGTRITAYPPTADGDA